MGDQSIPSFPSSPSSSSNSKVKEILSLLRTLDEGPFVRVLRRSCVSKRTKELLEEFEAGWLKTQEKIRSGSLEIEEEIVQGKNPLDVDNTLTSEDKITSVLKNLSDEDYRDVLIRCFDQSRPEELFRKVRFCWMTKLGLRGKFVEKEGSECPDQNKSALQCKKGDNAKSESPEVEIIDLVDNCSNASEISAKNLENEEITPSRSPSPMESEQEQMPKLLKNVHYRGGLTRRELLKEHRKQQKLKRKKQKMREKFRHRSRSRSRSRSPPRHRNCSKRLFSKSPPRKHRSPSPGSDKRFAESVLKHSNDEVFREKLALTAKGLWTGDLEISWTAFQIEETKLAKDFVKMGKRLAKYPEEYPSYAEEWGVYWENKATALRAAGKDPATHNFVPAWRSFWTERMVGLRRVDFHKKVNELQRKCGLDLESLTKHRKGQRVIPPSSTEHNLETGSSQSLIPIFDNQLNTNWNSIIETGAGPSQVVVNSHLAGPVPTNLEPISSASLNSLPAKTILSVDPLNLIHILRRLTLLEDQLGFLASPVHEFFKKAENLELSGKRNSDLLLMDKDFISLLGNCKVRFEALVRADVLPNDLMRGLKENIQSIQLVLESPKPKTPFPPTQSRPPNHIPAAPPILPVGKEDRPLPESRSDILLRAISKTFERLPDEQKEIVADILAEQLVMECRSWITEEDLLEFIGSFVPSFTEYSTGPGLSQNSGRNNRAEELAQQAQLRYSGLPWAGDYDSRIKRTTGTALPPIWCEDSDFLTTPPPRPSAPQGNTLIHRQVINLGVLDRDERYGLNGDSDLRLDLLG